jgi:hypothetical protein
MIQTLLQLDIDGGATSQVSDFQILVQNYRHYISCRQNYWHFIIIVSYHMQGIYNYVRESNRFESI